MSFSAKSQFLRFAAVGVVGFAVDAGTLYIGMSLLGLGLYSGRALSFLLAATTTWALNRSFTFPESSDGPLIRQWARFLLVNLSGASVNYGAYALVVSFWALGRAHPVIGVAVGSLSGLAFNFFGSKLFVFRSGKAQA